jgi:hypothetical protein
MHMVGLLDNGLSRQQGVTKDEIRQVRMVQRNRSQEQRFFLSPNSQLQPAVVFNGDSRHGSDPCLSFCTH